MRCLGVVLLACSCGTSARPVQSAPPAAPTPGDPTSRDLLVDQRKLLCGRIGSATKPTEVAAELDIGEMFPEGGSASVYQDGDLVRITGIGLFESQREEFDFRFQGDDLVCTLVTSTTAFTIEEQRPDNPDGRPPWWHEETGVYHQGVGIFSVGIEAPRGATGWRESASIVEDARTMRTMAKARRR